MTSASSIDQLPGDGRGHGPKTRRQAPGQACSIPASARAADRRSGRFVRNPPAAYASGRPDDVGDHRALRQQREVDVERRLADHAEAGRVDQQRAPSRASPALVPVDGFDLHLLSPAEGGGDPAGPVAGAAGDADGGTSRSISAATIARARRPQHQANRPGITGAAMKRRAQVFAKPMASVLRQPGARRAHHQACYCADAPGRRVERVAGPVGRFPCGAR